VDKAKLKHLEYLAQQADAIVKNETERRGLESSLFTVRAYSCNTVGVQGDSRTYEHAAEIIYSGSGKMDDEVYAALSTRIINEVPGINRVARFLAERED